MAKIYTLLILEDEPLILMDLELAAIDRGCKVHTATNCSAAHKALEEHGASIDVAILDVSLSAGCDCFPVARELEQRNIPYILHSGDLDRLDERIRLLDAELISKPAPTDKVIAAAIVRCEGPDPAGERIAAE